MSESCEFVEVSTLSIWDIINISFSKDGIVSQTHRYIIQYRKDPEKHANLQWILCNQCRLSKIKNRGLCLELLAYGTSLNNSTDQFGLLKGAW